MMEKLASTTSNQLARASLYAAFGFLLIVPHTSGEDVGDILQQIKQEKDSPQAATTISVPRSVATSPDQVETPKRPSSTPHSAVRQVQTQPSGPAIKIWAPKDKLPKRVEGQGVAGKFAVEGHYEGRLCLVPLEDRANPFARHFVVVNRSLNLPDFHVLPLPERELVEVPRDRPLIFESRGIMGYYYVRAQD
jgi:hypothetical protein